MRRLFEDMAYSSNYCNWQLKSLLHLGQIVITFRTLLHLGQNVITFRTLLHLGLPQRLVFVHRLACALDKSVHFRRSHMALFIPRGTPHNGLYGKTPRERCTFLS